MKTVFFEYDMVNKKYFVVVTSPSPIDEEVEIMCRLEMPSTPPLVDPDLSNVGDWLAAEAERRISEIIFRERHRITPDLEDGIPLEGAATRTWSHGEEIEV